MTPPECSICMEIIDPIFGFDTHCGHKFHLGCINRWCATNNSCPMCRTTGIITSSQYYLLNSNDQDNNDHDHDHHDHDDQDNLDINNNINYIINNNINNINNYINNINNYTNNRQYNLWSDNNINIIRNTIISNN